MDTRITTVEVFRDRVNALTSFDSDLDNVHYGVISEVLRHLVVTQDNIEHIADCLSVSAWYDLRTNGIGNCQTVEAFAQRLSTIMLDVARTRDCNDDMILESFRFLTKIYFKVVNARSSPIAPASTPSTTHVSLNLPF